MVNQRGVYTGMGGARPTEIFYILVLLKTYFTNGSLGKLIPGMVLFGTPERLAPLSNMAAPATLAPSPCHRGTRTNVALLTRQRGAPATLALPHIRRRQHDWCCPSRPSPLPHADVDALHVLPCVGAKTESSYYATRPSPCQSTAQSHKEEGSSAPAHYNTHFISTT